MHIAEAEAERTAVLYSNRAVLFLYRHRWYFFKIVPISGTETVSFFYFLLNILE